MVNLFQSNERMDMVDLQSNERMEMNDTAHYDITRAQQTSVTHLTARLQFAFEVSISALSLNKIYQ